MQKIILTFFLLFSTKLYAAQAFDLVKGTSVDAKSREYRAALADDLNKRFTSLYNAIPELTSGQTKYLQDEQNKINQLTNIDAKNRALAALAVSTPKALQESKQALNSLTKVLTCVKTIPKAEMTCWSLASYYLISTDVFAKIQKLAGMGILTIPDNTIPKTDVLGYGYFPSLFGQGILKFLIMPYIATSENVKLVIQ